MDDKKDKLELDEDIKLEENDNWKFEAEALTLNDTLLENDSVEIEIPGAKAEPVIQKPVVKEDRREPKKGKAKDGNIVKFVLVAVATAIVIAVLTVLGVYYYTVPNSDERMNPGNVAFTVGDTDVSIGMYNYYYTCLVQRDMQYASYYGLDTTKDFAEQITTDEDGNEITWADQFVNETVDQLQYITTYYEEAVKAGVTLTDEQKEWIDAAVEAATAEERAVVYRMFEESKQKVIEDGAEVTEFADIDIDAFKELAIPIQDEFAEKNNMTEYLEMVRNAAE